MNLFWSGAAYTILSIHVAFIFFLLLTPFGIVLGQWQGWSWTQNLSFRNIHILLLSYVVVEVLFSIPCFLTVMENSCRKKTNMPIYTTGFFDYWVETLFVTTYHDGLFIAILSLLAIVSFILYFAVPPLSR